MSPVPMEAALAGGFVRATEPVVESKSEMAAASASVRGRASGSGTVWSGLIVTVTEAPIAAAAPRQAGRYAR